MNKIQKQCEVCGQSFVPKTVDSVYCSKKCGAAAYRKKKALKKKKEEEQQAVIDKISADRLYISVPEAIALFGVAKSTLYRLVRQKRIPAINLGTRLVRIDRAAIEEMFPIRQTPLKKEKPTAKLYSLEPQDCYTIGEIAQKFGISDSTVYKHIRKFSIPTRQIGNYVYTPKNEIDNLYK
jgi:excisionase family DNA binding protein